VFEERFDEADLQKLLAFDLKGLLKVCAWSPIKLGAVS
jgi:hypothetical protein